MDTASETSVKTFLKGYRDGSAKNIIRESVDSLCRDGADTTRPLFKTEWLRTPKRGSYKPF